MPITSTKNFSLSSGFGVSNSRWPRWARSKIGSGCIPMSPGSTRRHVVEQFVDGIGARNKFLLRGVTDDQFQRAAHLVNAEARRGGRTVRGLREQPTNLTHDIRMLVRQRTA